MIEWAYFPQSDEPTEMMRKVVRVFGDSEDAIDSKNHPGQGSNEILAKITDKLISLGFRDEGVPNLVKIEARIKTARPQLNKEMRLISDELA